MAKRRRHGEGSVYQRKSDGKWLGVADFGWIDGKRVRKTVTGATEREAIKKLRTMIRDAERGVVPTQVTVADWLDRWLTTVAIPGGLRPMTERTYRTYITQYLGPILGKKKLAKLTPDDVRDLHAAMLDRGLSKATVRQAHAILQRALRVAESDGIVARNVAQIVSAPSPARNPHPILTVDEAQRVLRAARDDTRLRARLAVALMSGLRQGEALGLRWDDVLIDGDRGVLRVREAVSQVAGKGLVVGAPKTLSSVRAVPLVDLVALALTAWREESGGRGYVFHGHRGPSVPEGPRRDYQAWKDALEAAGVPHIPLHGARGSAASMLQAKGVPPRVIADILGHTTAQITTEHYLHSDDAQREDAMRLGFAGWREITEG